jgi:hypothetical protein
MLLLLLLALPVIGIPAQTTAETDAPPFIRETSPQWAKDVRRWNIVAFGSIPFTMLTATFAMDMYRWSNANGMNFTDEGRRYAPWPLKSAGAIAMDSKEQELTLLMAAGLSITIAVVDTIIVQAKRRKAQKKADALPVGTTIITRTPWPPESAETGEEAEQAAPATP